MHRSASTSSMYTCTTYITMYTQTQAAGVNKVNVICYLALSASLPNCMQQWVTVWRRVSPASFSLKVMGSEDWVGAMSAMAKAVSPPACHHSCNPASFKKSNEHQAENDWVVITAATKTSNDQQAPSNWGSTICYHKLTRRCAYYKYCTCHLRHLTSCMSINFVHKCNAL